MFSFAIFPFSPAPDHNISTLKHFGRYHAAQMLGNYSLGPA